MARDDFKPDTKLRMAQRAGYICSHPDCEQLTVGPSEDRGTRLTNVGEAAHITAASPNGPRYDASLTALERSAEANGIWLCRIHAKQVDDNASKEDPALALAEDDGDPAADQRAMDRARGLTPATRGFGLAEGGDRDLFADLLK